ncbi:MAG: tyrosine-type recombinase/integrase [Candidatus Eremiobacter antarcticus]
MTEEEAARFRAAAAETTLYALYATALDTGLRSGELLGLQWRDMNLGADAGYIRVAETLKKGEDRRLIRGSLKTVSSRRAVTLPRATIEVLREHRKRLFREGLGRSPWVFPNSDGGPLNKDNVNHRSLKPLLARAGLPNNVTFQILRRTHGTLLASKGVSPRAVQERLGHSNVRTTLEFYTEVVPSMRDAAVEALDEMASNCGQNCGQTDKQDAAGQ